MTTGTQIFEMAMAITDNLVNGVADVTDNAEYKARTYHIINSILPELYPYTTGVTITAGERPTPTFMTSISDSIPLDDSLCNGVLVHGVIALLFSIENPTLSADHQRLYLEKLAKLKNIPGEFAEIEDIYYDARMFNTGE